MGDAGSCDARADNHDICLRLQVLRLVCRDGLIRWLLPKRWQRIVDRQPRVRTKMFECLLRIDAAVVSCEVSARGFGTMFVETN